MKMIVKNPYYEEKYITNDIDKERWLNFIKNVSNGNEDIIFFKDEIKNNYITINPRKFASIEVQFDKENDKNG